MALLLESNLLTKTVSRAIGIFALVATFPFNMFVSHIDYPKSATVQDGDTFDIIIVGGGTAGCALAAKLSKNGNLSILLIEGGGDPPVQSSIPAFTWMLVGSEYDYQYVAVDDHYTSQAMVDNAVSWPAGKMLGGTNALINFFYSQGSKGNYDQWAQLGNDGWSWNDVKPYFLEFEKLNPDTAEKNPGIGKNFGVDGQFDFGDANYPYKEFNKMLKDAYKELGFPKNDDFFPGENPFGAGEMLAMVNNGKRVNTATAFLFPANNRSNLHVLKTSRVKKVIIKDNKAVGVAIDGFSEKKIYASKEVILTAGTFGTAQLLMLSGIGDKKELEKFNIETKLEKKVGKQFDDHVLLPIYFFGDADKPNLETQVYFASQVAQYMGNNTGLLSSNLVSNFVTFFSDKNLEQPEFELIHFYSPAGTDLASITCNVGYKLPINICTEIALCNLKYDLLIIHLILLKSESYGEMSLKSDNINDHPNIKSGFFSNKNDLDKTVKALRILNNLTETAAFKSKNYKFLNLNIKECADKKIGTNEYWKCFAVNQAATIYHPVGSAKMGKETDENALVDNELRVYGIDNLRIGDASIMPSQISGHTTSPVIMIAHKLADMIQKKYC